MEIHENGVELVDNFDFMKLGQEYMAWTTDNASAKINPTDGDKFPFWGETFEEIRQIPWANLLDAIASGIDLDYSDISSNDASTDVTGAELEELTDGSKTLPAHTFCTVSTTHTPTLTNVPKYYI